MNHLLIRDIPNWNTNKHFNLDTQNSFMDISNSWIAIIGLWISIAGGLIRFWRWINFHVTANCVPNVAIIRLVDFSFLDINGKWWCRQCSVISTRLYRERYVSWSNTILIFYRLIFIQENMVPFHWHVFWLYWLSKYRRNIHIITSYIKRRKYVTMLVVIALLKTSYTFLEVGILVE